MTGVARDPGYLERRRRPGHRARPRRRGGLDRFVIGCCSLALVGVFALWTGIVPVMYVPNPGAWHLSEPQCTTTGEVLPSVEHTFPLWSRVSFSWIASSPVEFLAEGPGGPAIAEVGSAGNGSFVSNANPVVFEALPAIPAPLACNSTVLVQIFALFSA